MWTNPPIGSAFTICCMTAFEPTAFPLHDDAWYQSRLALPRGKRRVVIDTDCANEIDDQFALAWALCLTE